MSRARAALTVTATLALLTGVATAQDDEEPRARQATLTVKPARGKAVASDRAWLQMRLSDVSVTIVEDCYRPALAIKPRLAGKLVVRFKVARGLTITGVRADVDRFRLPTFRACVQAAVRKHVLVPPAPPPAPRPDPRDPLTRPPFTEPDRLPGAYVNPPGPPPASRLPLTVAVTFEFTAPPPPPPPPPAPPKRTCGANPAGCKSTGCPSGLVCDTKVRCVSSACSCDPTTGTWICTTDCGGGMCVRPGTKSPL